MIGHVVSHYRVLQKLGGGGMGVVYKAEDLKLRRTVALKFLAPELTRDEDAKKRFLHEAQAASALDHPNICGIYEIDETPEGQLFIAMSCYEGESLKQRIARRGLDVEEAFQIAFAVAQGLGCAHASNIIHRDVKPANIMITGDGFVKIIDFGLSKLIGRSRVTGSGATLGTVAYMSPEQARSEEVDARADIWALGAVLYEMLTGRLPFRGEIDQAVVYSILNEAPEPIRKLNTDVPEVCAAIVNKCLAKDPGDRYQSAEDFCVAVFEAGKKLGWGDSFMRSGVRAVSVVGGRRRSRRVRPVFAVAAGLVAVVALLAWHPWKGSSPYTTDIRLAVASFERIGDAPSQALVDGITTLASESFTRASRVHNSMWVLPRWRIDTDRPATRDRFRTAFGVNRIVTGSVVPFEQGYRVSLSLRDSETDRVLRTASIEVDPARGDRLPSLLDGAASRLVGVDSLRLETPGSIRASNDDCRVLYESMGVLAHSPPIAKVEEALPALATAAMSDTTCVAMTTQLGFMHLLIYEDNGSAADHSAADRLLTLSALRDSTDTSASRLLARLRAREERHDEAIAILRDCIRRDPRDMGAYEQLGSLFTHAQRYEEAKRVYASYARRFPDYYYPHWLLGWLYSQTGEEPLRFAELKRALELAPDDHHALNTMGIYYSDRGEWVRARELWERAFLVHPTCANCGNVGYVLYFEGRYGDSARYFEYALDYCDTTRFIYWGNLASALYWTPGQRERSTAIYRRAIARARDRLADVPDDESTTSWLATYYAMIGDRDEALLLAGEVASSDDAAVMYHLAQIYEFLGERTEALHYIGETVRRSYPLYEIMNEPILADLKKDPRFLQLVENEKVAARDKGESR
jgi:tetratricopeptide (TPR) repeat protein